MSNAGTITFQFEDTPFKLHDRRAVRSWLLNAANQAGTPLHEVHFLFCSDERILAANQQHLGHDYFTDILTFPALSAQGLSADILISIDRVRDNAKTHGVSAKHELHRVMAHGILHLQGFDDTTNELKAAMTQAEDAWLAMRPAHIT